MISCYASESFYGLRLDRSFDVSPSISILWGLLGLEIKISFYLMIFLGVSLYLWLISLLRSSIEFKLLSLCKLWALSNSECGRFFKGFLGCSIFRALWSN